MSAVAESVIVLSEAQIEREVERQREELEQAFPRMEKELAQRSLREYVPQAWGIVDPATFMVGKHVDAITEHLEAVTRGQVRNLLITMPPRLGKSLFAAVMWPSWSWIDHPELRWLFSSHNEKYSIRDNVRCRRIIESPWYRARWGHVYRLLGDQNEKIRYENTKSGLRVATSVGGAATGEGGDIVVCDDPINVDDAFSDAIRERSLIWWDETMSTRLNDPRTGRKVIVMQRVHDDDLAGHVLRQGGYVHLNLPMEFEPPAMVTGIGWKDQRTEEGELLWPDRWGPDELAEQKLRLGSYGYAAQFQQRPSPRGGGAFKRHWWRYWVPKGITAPPVQVRDDEGRLVTIDAIELPETFDQTLQSWDMAFKDLTTSDYVVGQVWGRKGPRKFVFDQTRKQLNMPDSLVAVRAMTKKWPSVVAKLVEDKANGPAVVATLTREIPGLLPIDPEGGKESRAAAVSPEVEAGNVFLPHPSVAPWVNEFIEEHASFPRGRYDDQVDACTQALRRFQRTSGAFIGSLTGVTSEIPGPSYWGGSLGLTRLRRD